MICDVYDYLAFTEITETILVITFELLANIQYFNLLVSHTLDQTILDYQCALKTTWRLHRRNT